MAVISKVINGLRGFFYKLTGLIMDGQTADPTAASGAALLYYRSDSKRLRFQDDGGTFANLAREDAGVFASLSGSGNTPTVAVGNAAQLGTGPTASVAGSTIAPLVTFTPGSTPSAFVAGTAVTLFTLTLPAGLYSAAPNNVSIDPANAQAAQDETGTNGIAYFYDQGSSTATSIVIKAICNGTPTLGAGARKLSLGITG